MRTRLIFILIALALAVVAFWFSPYHQVRSIFTVVEINAPDNRVWNVLTDLNSYSSWNPFLTSASGTLEPGSKIAVSMKITNRTITFHPRIVTVQNRNRLVWRGTLLTSAILEGEHSFELEPIDQSHTRLIQSERYRGVLLVFLWNRYSAEVARGFTAMNQALKRRAETQ